MQPEISVVVSTYNRVDSLVGTIQSVLAQENVPEFELIVVDNNCTDATAAAVRALEAQNPRLHYVFEARQGVSYGRNAGIAASRASIIAFTDDDVVADKNWLATIKRTFDEHPECGCVGGKVLPLWPAPAPAWLKQRHWSPLALLDYGEPQSIGAENPKCLITANMSVRREIFDSIGYFLPAFQKTKGSTCSVEDRELQERYWRAGGRCWFDPNIIVYAEVQPNRLTKAYHRKWHFSHGELHALMRDPALESSHRSVFGVPGHIRRRAITHSRRMLWSTLKGDSETAFAHELEARFCFGFIRKRLSESRSSGAVSPAAGL
jgi:glucosyl-dolichyl phosphate glucuronosyltransferase